MSILRTHHDAIVVGSGPSGSIAVKELTERGLDVLLLEAGRDISDADFPPMPEVRPRPMGIGLLPRARSALRGQPVQALRTFYRESTDPLLVNDRENPYSTPKDAWYLWLRARILGGRMHTYGKMLLRMSDNDFQGRTRDGHGEDWPITSADIAPWYDHVEKFIGIYGHADGLDVLPDGQYVGPSKLTAAEQDFRDRVQGRWPARKVVSWRYQAPNPVRVPKGIVAARATGRLTTRTDAVVREITTHPQSGRATGAVFVDRVTRQEHRVTADVVVLCASTIESIRLLLNSASPRYPGGLANSSGLVGRYFMDQAPSLTFGRVPSITGWERDGSAPYDPFYPPAGGIYIPRFHNLDGHEDPRVRKGLAYQGAVGRFPQPDDHPAAFALMGFCEMLPYFDNTVTLDPRRTDAWGVPVPFIRCVAHENEQALMRESVRIVKEISAELGYELNFTGSPLGLDTRRPFPDADPLSRLAFKLAFKRSVAMGTAIHECGGIRMGSDPKTSVLNEHNQSWDVPNLFVTDASSFVSNGLVGPTLTIMALTARACDHIASSLADGELAA